MKGQLAIGPRWHHIRTAAWWAYSVDSPSPMVVKVAALGALYAVAIGVTVAAVLFGTGTIPWPWSR